MQYVKSGETTYMTHFFAMSIDFGLLARLYFHSLHYEKFPDGTVKCIEDEIPFELPEGWEWTRIFSVSFNLPYGTAKKSDSNGKVAVLRMGNLQNGEIDYSDLVYSSDDEDINQYELLENDLLFNRTNSAEWVGKTAIYRGGVKAIYAGYLIRLRTGLNAEYLNAVMNSQYERDYCNMVKTDGVNQSNINAQKLGAFLIPVPSISEQCRIVCKFNNLLSFIETIESDKTDLQTTIQLTKSKILDLAIRGKLVPQNPDDEPASVLLDRVRAEKEELIKQGKIKRDKKESVIYKGDDNSYYEVIGSETTSIDDEIPFDLPEKWEWVRLGVLFSHNTGKALNKKDTIGIKMTYITTSNLYWDRFELNSLKEMNFNESEIEKCTVQKGDLLVCEGGDIGRAAIWNYDNEIRIQNHIHKLRPYSEVSVLLYYYVFYYYKLTDRINGKGIGIQGLSSNQLHNIFLPLPPLSEQKRIADKVSQLFSLLDSIEENVN